MLTLVWLAAVVAAFFALAYVNAAGWLWTGAIAVALAAAWGANLVPLFAVIVLAGLLVVLAIPLNFPSLRRGLISDGVLAVRKILPPRRRRARRNRSGTGLGRRALLRRPMGKLPQCRSEVTAEEQHFFDHECEELCAMVTDWETTHIYLDLPQPVWQYIKDKGFLGMIIPKEYGGLGFSAFAHSQVVVKLASRCSALVVTVMVPNSLGPGELLMHYGTDEQKRYYLPRLAKGLEIPCFRVDQSHAGSDAAAIPDTASSAGASIRPAGAGAEAHLGKRYITLGPVATILGLAFRAFRSRASARRQGRPGHHLRADSDRSPRVNIGGATCPFPRYSRTGRTGDATFYPDRLALGGKVMIGKGGGC